MNAWLIVFNLCVALFMTIGLVTDLKYWKLPNWLTVSAFLAGLAFHAIVGWVEAGLGGVQSHLWFSLKGFGLGFILFFIPWLIGSGSAGDCKLMAAVGAWLGPMPTIIAIILSGLFELLHLVFLFAMRIYKIGVRRTFNELKMAQDKSKPKDQRPKSILQTKTPYSVSAMLATWIVVLTLSIAQTSWSKHWHPQAQADVGESMQEKAT